MRRLGAMIGWRLAPAVVALALLAAGTWTTQAGELQVRRADGLTKLSVLERLRLAADVSDELARSPSEYPSRQHTKKE